MSETSNETLLIGGRHNFEELAPILAESLESSGPFMVTATTDWEKLREEHVNGYDVVLDYVVDYNAEMTDEQRSGLLSFVRSGGGYVGLHGAAAMFGVPDDGDPDLLAEQERMLGGRLVDHPGVLETQTEIVDNDHPITRDITDFSFVDEPYELAYDRERVNVLACTSHESFGEMPVAWTKDYGSGRVFYYSAGHDERAFRNENFQTLVRRGVEWAIGRS